MVTSAESLPAPLARLEELALPAHLDGSRGDNRARGARQIAADEDLAAIRVFLHEYGASPRTQAAYRKEIERLVLWAVLQRGRALSSLTREDFLAYEEFLRDPQPAARWCGPRRGRAGARFSAGWRPFVGPLGAVSRRTALTIVNSFLNYLVQAAYLAGNPLGLLRRAEPVGAVVRSARHRVARRCLDAAQWGALLAALEGLPRDRPRQQAIYERARFLLALLHFLALRLGEVERHRMGDFACLRGRWVFCVVGKGRKEATVPVNDEMLAALRAFRAHLGLPPLPAPDEDTPLVPRLGGSGGVGARRVNQVLKGLCRRAAAALEAEDPQRAADLRRASAHWFRHTALTRQWEKGIPLLHIKANARHARLDTTLLYVHEDDDARHDEAQKLTWK